MLEWLPVGVGRVSGNIPRRDKDVRRREYQVSALL